ncbi:MAG: hypothetical protein AB7S55_01760 [Thiomonas sp.]
MLIRHDLPQIWQQTRTADSLCRFMRGISPRQTFRLIYIKCNYIWRDALSGMLRDVNFPFDPDAANCRGDGLTWPGSKLGCDQWLHLAVSSAQMAQSREKSCVY